MDLPPRFRHHPWYGNVPHPPCFVHHNLTPHAPPPLPPSPPLIFLPPLLPPRHDGQLPFPSHFSSPPYLPILERSYFQELDPLRKYYLDRYQPPHQDNSPLRIIHDYSLRDSVIEDEIFRRGCNNSYAYDFPRTWDREFPCGATEGNSRISEMEHRRYSNSRISGIETRDMWKDTNADARRWDNGSRDCTLREKMMLGDGTVVSMGVMSRALAGTMILGDGNVLSVEVVSCPLTGVTIGLGWIMVLMMGFLYSKNFWRVIWVCIDLVVGWREMVVRESFRGLGR